MNLRFWLTHPMSAVRRLRYYVWEKFNSDKPWLCPGTVQFCANHMDRSMHALEFGSGRSTTWFAQRLGRLTSVESDSGWHQIVSEKLHALQLANVDYRHIPLEHTQEEAEHILPGVTPAYVRVIDEFADGSLDWVIVDGHYRDCCIRHALAKIKPGGHLLVDDVNFWPSLDCLPVPASWKIVNDSDNGLKRGVIWKAGELA